MEFSIFYIYPVYYEMYFQLSYPDIPSSGCHWRGRNWFQIVGIVVNYSWCKYKVLVIRITTKLIHIITYKKVYLEDEWNLPKLKCRLAQPSAMSRNTENVEDVSLILFCSNCRGIPSTIRKELSNGLSTKWVSCLLTMLAWVLPTDDGHIIVCAAYDERVASAVPNGIC